MDAMPSLLRCAGPVELSDEAKDVGGGGWSIAGNVCGVLVCAKPARIPGSGEF